ncbi:MAG: TonB-dependent receptor [Alphaproteobacteria bacterium]|nr:TonB-dependent receptor [Alphaproteobacteria bacterium]
MNAKVKSRLLSAVLPLAVLIPAAGAWAQQSAAGAPSAASGDGVVETVVVTATRRSESVQDVGGGLTALTGDDLSQMHASSFADFASTVPSLSYASGGATTNLIAIRGVTSGTEQKGSAVGIYLDDVPIGSSVQFGIGSDAFNFNLFDMDRVEVLDGPQGTLYGADSLGGAIKYITSKPDLTAFAARGEIEGSDTEHGSFNDGLRVMANLPLFGDAALRVDAYQQFDSGYAQDPSHGRKDVGSGQDLGGRVSFFAQITPDLDVRLTAMSQSDRANGYDVVLKDFLTHQPVQGPYDQSYALAQPSSKRLDLYSGEVNWNWQWATLTSVTSYQNNDFKTDADLSPVYDLFLGTAAPMGLPTHLTTKKFTQEVRVASPDNKSFEWVVGGFFTREITDETIMLVDGATANGQLPPFTGNDVNAPDHPILPFFGYLPSTYREFAVFGDATYYFSDDFDVTAGVRYSTQHQTYRAQIQTLLFPDPFTLNYIPAMGDETSNQSVVTYLFNPRWRVTDDTMVYAKVSSGFRPGGPNFTGPATFSPDKLWNYELGEKSTLLDGRAVLNFDVYDIEWSDIQTTANIGGINNLVNAGNARVQGAETSFSYRILPQLTVDGSASYTDAHLTGLTANEESYLGIYHKNARLPLSPRYNFALGGTYAFDLGGGYRGALNVSDVYVGERNANFDVDPAGLAVGAGSPLYKLAAYNTVNLNLSFFLPDNIEVDGYVKNVFDVRGEVSANAFEDQYLNPYLFGIGLPYAPVPVMLSQPRTIGLVLKVATGG